MLRVGEHASRSDTGRQRNANEDSYFVRAPIFVVADGMGGAQAGEVASQTVAECFEREMPDGPPERALPELIRDANRRIHQMAREDPSVAGMGTTTTALIVDPEREEVVIGHVGDSRAYRLRDGELERLTRDHSLVEEMRRKGQITDEQAQDHPQRSVITRALGPEADVEVDVRTVPARAGDVFLICSDGLTTMLDERRIAGLIEGATSLEHAVRALVEEANRAGGRDNITAILFRLEDAAQAAAAAPPPDDGERPTLVGPSAAEEGFTADEVRRRAASSRREPPRRRGLRRAAKVLAALLVLGALVFAAWWGNRQVYFLGTDDAGRVALYRGLPYDLPLGISLYEKRYSSPLQTASLPPRRRESVTDHDFRSEADAESLIQDLERSNAAREQASEPEPPAGTTGETGAAGPTGATGVP